jgi:hypothetical protein
MSRMRTPLTEVINTFLLSRDEDSYIKNTSRTKIISLARRGLQELTRNVGGNLKSVRLDVVDGFFVNFPNDFMAFSKIGVLTQNGEIKVLKMNEEMDISRNMLKDSEEDVLVDSDGIELLEGRSPSSQFDPNVAQQSIMQIPFYNYWQNGSYFQMYGVPAGNNNKGQYRVDYVNNRIEFSSDLFSLGDPKQIILEYVGDDTKREEPLIDVRLHEALYAFIYWKCLEGMYKAPANEKQMARQEYYNRRRLAFQEIKPIKLQEIIHTLREGNKKSPKF